MISAKADVVQAIDTASHRQADAVARSASRSEARTIEISAKIVSAPYARSRISTPLLSPTHPQIAATA
jgi:hypothetical protein